MILSSERILRCVEIAIREVRSPQRTLRTTDSVLSFLISTIEFKVRLKGVFSSAFSLSLSTTLFSLPRSLYQ